MCMDHAVALTAGKSLYTAHKNSYNVETSLASCWDDMTRCALPHSQHVERQQHCTRRLLFKFCLSLVNVHVHNQPNNIAYKTQYTSLALFNSANCKWKTYIWYIHLTSPLCYLKSKLLHVHTHSINQISFGWLNNRMAKFQHTRSYSCSDSFVVVWIMSPKELWLSVSCDIRSLHSCHNLDKEYEHLLLPGIEIFIILS